MMLSAAALAVAFLMDPYDQFIAYTRAELARSGMERVQFGENVYWRGGSGPVLVLLHGANDQAGTWSPVTATLVKSYRVIAPDLSGHGESGPAEGPVAMSRMVGELHAILDREHIECATLAGNSMGGWVAMLYALEHPGRVDRLVLEDASGMIWPLTVPLVANDRDAAMKIMHAVHGPTAPVPEWTIDALMSRAGSSPMLRVGQAGVLQYLLDNRLGDLNVPATLIWGANDGVLPVAYAEALQKKIKRSELFVIDDAAHIPHRQQPERFLECLSKSSSPSARD
jgi:pimeloyl-ACP methyl ester carboxylesterase